MASLVKERSDQGKASSVAPRELGRDGGVEAPEVVTGLALLSQRIWEVATGSNRTFTSATTARSSLLHKHVGLEAIAPLAFVTSLLATASFDLADRHDGISHMHSFAHQSLS